MLQLGIRENYDTVCVILLFETAMKCMHIPIHPEIYSLDRSWDASGLEKTMHKALILV